VLAGLAEHWGEIDESLNPDLDDIATAYADGRTVVAALGGEVIGTGTVVPRRDGVAEILRMSVRSDLRRQGVGRAIVSELLATATAWGVRTVVLETTADWADVVAFYRGCGFTITHHDDGAFGRDAWFELRLDDAATSSRASTPAPTRDGDGTDRVVTASQTVAAVRHVATRLRRSSYGPAAPKSC